MADETAVETAPEESTSDVGELDTGASAETETDMTETADAPEKDDAEPEPELFMSPGAQRLKAAQEKAKQESRATATGRKPMADSMRTRLAAEARQKFEAEMPWVQGLSAEEGANVRKLYDLGERDPIRLVDALVQKMAASPVYRSQIESYLQHFYQPAKPDADPEPGPDVPTSESAGKPVVYSASQQKLWGEWQRRQILSEADKRMKPLMDDQQQRQTQQRTDQENRAYQQGIESRQLSRPGFKEHAAEIQAAYNAAPRPWNTDGQAHTPREMEMYEEHLLAETYHSVLMKTARDDAAKKIAADLKLKQGHTGVTGTGGTTTAQDAKPPKNMRESMTRARKKMGWD